MRKVVILGGEGNGVVVANAILHAERMGATDLHVEGLLNDRVPVDQKIDMFPVVGKLADTKRFLDEDYWFVNTILRIDGNRERLELFDSLQIPDERLATFIHPMAYIAPSVQLAPGCIIMPQAALSPGSKLGRGTIVMVGVTMGHDNHIGEFCHVAANACVGSCLQIGRGVHIGLNATVRENLRIGDYATLGMGAVLTKDMGEREIWVGNPARFLRMSE